MAHDTTPNRYVPGEAAVSPAVRDRIDRRDRAMGPAYRLSYAKPVHFVRGEGVWLYDADGEAYLDFYNNVASLGHCHPRVVDAMTRQAATLCTNTRYLHDGVIEYAERLTGLVPIPRGQAMFTCSGSEANDLACRIARHATGGDGFIVTEHAYHGTSHLVAGLSPNLGPSVPLHPSVRTVPAPAAARTAGDVGDVFKRHVTAAAEDLLRHGIRPAALLVDSLFSSDGVYPDPPGFLSGAVDAIRDAGGLFIADEVQPGFARTGDAMWGFQRHGVTPDIATLGKPMGNGYPMAGLVADADVVDGFGETARYFNTFAGNSVAAANGLAVLDVLHDDGLMAHAKSVGGYLKDCLRSVGARCLGEVRGAGLFLGVEVVADGQAGTPDRAAARRLVNGLRDRKILISSTGKHDNVLKIRPPLIATEEHVDRFMDVLVELLDENGGPRS